MKYEKEINEIKDILKEFNDLFVDNFDNTMYKKMRLLYKTVVSKCSELYSMDDITPDETATLDDYLDTAEVLLETANQNSLILLTSEVEKCEEKIEKQQGLQFAVFSMLISVISFVLTNAIILTDHTITLKTILIVNFSYLLAVSSLFALIYVFMGFVSKNGNKAKNLIVLLGIPILFSILLIVSYFVL